jgi:hypothetical protein
MCFIDSTFQQQKRAVMSVITIVECAACERYRQLPARKILHRTQLKKPNASPHEAARHSGGI